MMDDVARATCGEGRQQRKEYMLGAMCRRVERNKHKRVVIIAHVVSEMELIAVRVEERASQQTETNGV